MRKDKLKAYDVAVIGGGVSGVCSAVTAARKGLSVALIEKNDFLGGTAVIGMHNFICGLYLNGNDFPKRMLNPGLSEEICSGLKSVDSQAGIKRLGNVYAFSFRPEKLNPVLAKLTKQKKHPEIFLKSELAAVRKENDLIQEIRVKRNNRYLDLEVKSVIDCSGEALVSRLSKIGFYDCPEAMCQLSGFTLRIKGVDPDEMNAFKVPYYLRKLALSRRIPDYLKFVNFVNLAGGEGLLKLSFPPILIKGLNKKAVNYAKIIHKFISRQIPAFKDSFIAQMSSCIIQRESYRTQGRYCFTKDDVLKARKFTDGVVKNSWPIEIWEQKKGPIYRYLKPGEFYEIPARSLTSKHIANLFCAGKCISVSHEALGSTRAMGTCISLGEQAGILAASQILR